MANITVPGLPAKTGTILGAAYLHLNESSVDKKVTIAQLLAKIESEYSSDIVSFLGSANKAEGRANLSIDRRVTVDDANYTILATDKVVSQIGTMSAARTFSLPAASTVEAGAEIIVIDESGSVDSTNKITVQRNGTDTIDGLTSFEILQSYGVLTLICDGSNSWKIKNNGDVRNLYINNKFNIKNINETISSGSINYSGSYIIVDTEASASSDDLDTINNGKEGDILLLRSSDNSRNIIIKHLTGNIRTNTQTDIILDLSSDILKFQYRGSTWDLISRSTRLDFLSSRSTNGYTYFPNGIIIQWGRNNVTSGTSVTLPITMSSFYCSNTHHFGVVPSIGTCAVETVSNITLYHTSGGSVDIEWLVIGKV